MRIKDELQAVSTGDKFSQADYKAVMFAAESIYAQQGFNIEDTARRRASESFSGANAAQKRLSMAIEGVGAFIAGIFKAIYKVIESVCKWIYNAIARLFGGGSSGGGGGGGGGSDAEIKKISAGIGEIKQKQKEILDVQPKANQAFFEDLNKLSDKFKEQIQEIVDNPGGNSNGNSNGNNGVSPVVSAVAEVVGKTAPKEFVPTDYALLAIIAHKNKKALSFKSFPNICYNDKEVNNAPPDYIEKELKRLNTVFENGIELVRAIAEENMNRHDEPNQVLFTRFDGYLDKWCKRLEKLTDNGGDDAVATVTYGPIIGNKQLVAHGAKSGTTDAAGLSVYKVELTKYPKATIKKRFLRVPGDRRRTVECAHA
jgi:hypothetical protein